MEKINQNNFSEKIAKGTVLVDFSATWCGPCKMLAPVLEKVAAEMKDQASFFTVDVDESEALSAQFGIQAVPTMILFKDGAVVDRQTGFMGAPQIVDFINKGIA